MSLPSAFAARCARLSFVLLFLALAASAQAELARLDHVSVPTSRDGHQAGVVDPAGEWIYLATDGPSGSSGACRVDRVNTSTATASPGIPTPNSNCLVVADALMEPGGQYAYFFFQFYNVGAPADPFYMRVYRLDLNSFAWDGFLTLETSSGAAASLMDPAGQYAYFSRNSGLGAMIYKVDLSTFTLADSFRLESVESNVYEAWIHPTGSVGFFVTASNDSASDQRVVRVDLDNMLRIDSTPVPGGLPVRSVAVDPASSHAYLGTESSPGVVHKIDFDLFDFAWSGSISLDSGENDLVSAVADTGAGVVHFGTDTQPGRVVTVELSGFQRVGAVTLPAEESSLRVALADPVDPFFYVAANDGSTPLGERLVRLAELEGIPFVTTWQSDNPGSSGSAELTIPTAGGGYDYDLYWESLDVPGHSGWLFGLNGSKVVDVEVTGRHRVSIYGQFPRIYFNNTGDRRKILSVEQWGDIEWSSMFNAFAGATNLEIEASDAPDLSQATSLAFMFRGASSVDSDFSHWDVSTITDMRSVFHDASSFDRSLGGWSVGAVTTMSGMLDNAGLSTASYDATLTGWAAQTVQSVVTLSASGLEYCAAGARQSLVNDGWSILGDTQASGCAGTAPATPVLDSPPDSATNVPVAATLDWNAASGADVYDLQVATDLGFSNRVIDASGIAQTSRQVSGLDYLTLYYWRVRARNDAGASGWSTVRKFTTEDNPASPPPAPVLQSPPDLATDIPVDVTFSWNSATGAETYRLQIAENASFSPVLFDRSNITATGTTVTGLDEGTGYYWRVRAVNAAGNGPFSAPSRFTTESAVAQPDPPNPISPADLATDVPLDVTLVWDEPLGADSYRVQVALNASFTVLAADKLGLLTPDFSPTNLQPTTLYYWRVRATNAAGNSAWSDAVRFETGVPPVDKIFGSGFEAD